MFGIARKQVSPSKCGWRKTEEIDWLPTVPVGVVRAKTFVGKSAPDQSVRVRDVVFRSSKGGMFVVVFVNADVIPTHPYAMGTGLNDVDGTVSLFASILVEQLSSAIRLEELVAQSHAAR